MYSTDDDTQPQQQHPQIAPEASRVKITLNAKRQHQYEISLGYKDRDEMRTWLGADLDQFASIIRRVFPDAVAADGGE